MGGGEESVGPDIENGEEDSESLQFPDSSDFRRRNDDEQE